MQESAGSSEGNALLAPDLQLDWVSDSSEDDVQVLNVQVLNEPNVSDCDYIFQLTLLDSESAFLFFC